MRVLAAMSGGVDSAVAAARAVDVGHDVTGVHMALSSAPATMRNGSRGCCTLEDSRDARRAADVLGVPFYVWDLAEPFREAVVEDFLSEYAAGRTPNPCMRCNERIKFAELLHWARLLGFDAVVTGHYAQLSADEAGTPVLRRAVDLAKDQSYVLATLGADQLGGALFPLGDTAKSDVRREAAERGLLVAYKPDSHDICFIPDGDTAGFLRRHLGQAPGPVVEADSGAVLGEHRGTHAFTVGQRRGLGIGRAPDGRPRYVLGVEPVTRTVRVGPHEALAVTRIEVADTVWHAPEPREPMRALAQYRAHGAALGCEVTVGSRGGMRVVLDSAAHGVAPGQTIVIYEPGGCDLGGGPRTDRVLAAGRILEAAGGRRVRADELAC